MITRLSDLEAKFHNPKAEVVYDILAFRGGVQLYSRLAGLYEAASGTDGAPTQGVRELFAEQRKELDSRDTDLKKLLDDDLGTLNAMAKKLDLPTVILGGGS